MHTILHSISGPYLTTGKYGKAVYTPNTEGHYDDNQINLGTHDNDCFGNVSHCTNGATLSFWIKAHEQMGISPRLLLGSWFFFGFNMKNGELLESATLRNGTHSHFYTHFAKVTYNQWHNIGMTYSPGKGFEVYFDGCKALRTGLATSAPISTSIELGCTYGGQYCCMVNYDELRFWAATKSPRFMWWLSQM